MGKKKQWLFIGALIVAVLLFIALSIVALIGTFKLTDGCLLRYPDTGGLNSSDNIIVDFELRADGNYVIKQNTTLDINGNSITTYGPDPTKYGSWLKVPRFINPNHTVKLMLSGEVSLCKAYLPINNIQNANNLDNLGNKIPVPRIESSEDPVPLILDAKNNEWRNLAEVYQFDKLEVFLEKDQLPIKDAGGNILNDASNINVFDRFINANRTANCSEGQNSYSPICGRYTPYTTAYLKECRFINTQCEGCKLKVVPFTTYTDTCNQVDSTGIASLAILEKWMYDCSYYDPIYANPAGYSNPSGYVVSPETNLQSLLSFQAKYTPENCADSGFRTIVDSSSYQDNKKVWFSANDASGLLYRLDDNLNPTNKNTTGTDYTFSTFTPTSATTVSHSYKRILEYTSYDSLKYLQYRLADTENPLGNTGGYVLRLKHTKCRRENGGALNDPNFTDRGRVEYLLVNDFNADPNIDASIAASSTPITFDGNGNYDFPTGSEGYLWLKIKNKAQDYQDSFGHYQATLNINTGNQGIQFFLFDKLFTLFKEKYFAVSQNMFKNMICYQSTDKSSCTNFFNYIRAVLILYIVSQALLFLMGFIELSQKELVIKVIKIAIIAGLINEKTYEYLNFYFFPLVTNAADDIIGKLDYLSDYKSDIIVNGNVIGSNPFRFADELFSRMFLSFTFYGQVMSLFSMGSQGIIYFVLTLIAITITFLTILRAAAIYIMAFVAQGFLIGLSPLFLTFMLFEQTKTIFESWLKYFIRYALEPVIVLSGLIIFVKLFTVYLDYLLDYSVCWKCALAFTIPFPNIPVISSLAATKIPLFCINWFAPWGTDPAGISPIMPGGGGGSGVMASLNFPYIIALIIISYAIKGYVQLASSITVKLAGEIGPSATSAARGMSNALEQGALKQFGLDRDTVSSFKASMNRRFKNSRAKDQELNEEINNNNKRSLVGNNNVDNNSRGEETRVNPGDQNNPTRPRDVPNNNNRTGLEAAPEAKNNNNLNTNLEKEAPKRVPPNKPLPPIPTGEAAPNAAEGSPANNNVSDEGTREISDKPQPPTKPLPPIPNQEGKVDVSTSAAEERPNLPESDTADNNLQVDKSTEANTPTAAKDDKPTDPQSDQPSAENNADIASKNPENGGGAKDSKVTGGEDGTKSEKPSEKPVDKDTTERTNTINNTPDEESESDGEENKPKDGKDK